MTKWLPNIANSMTYAGFILLVSTILVTDPESMHGLFVTKQFWFYSSLAIVGLLGLALTFFNLKSISDIDVIKTIFLGILTVVIIDISRNPNTEMMNAHLLLLVIISFFFFNTFLNYNIKSGKTFHFILMALALLEVIWGYFQLFAYVPGSQTALRISGSLNTPDNYALFLAVITPVALYWTITIYKRLKNKRMFSSSSPDEEHHDSEIIDDILLFVLSALSLVAILSMLPLTRNPLAYLVAGSGCVLVLYFILHVGTWLKQTFFYVPKRGLAMFSLVLVGCTVFTGIYLIEKKTIDERLLSWKISRNVLTEKTWTGIGIGNFPKVYGDAQSDYFAHGEHQQRELALVNNPRYPVNDLLQITAETGIVGVVLCASLVITILVKGIQRLKEYPEKLAVLGALASFAVACIFASPLSSLSLSVIFITLLALATPRNAARHKYTRVATIAVQIVLTGLMVSIIYPQYHKVEAYQKWSEGRLYYSMKVYATAANIYAPLAETLKGHPEFLYEYGNALSQAERYDESNAILEEATQILADPMIYNLIGKNYQALGNYKLAEQNFRKAHFMVPHLMYPNFLLAKLYHEMGLSDKMFQCAQKVIVQETKKSSRETLDMIFQMQELIKNINWYPHQ